MNVLAVLVEDGFPARLLADPAATAPEGLNREVERLVRERAIMRDFARAAVHCWAAAGKLGRGGADPFPSRQAVQQKQRLRPSPAARTPPPRVVSAPATPPSRAVPAAATPPPVPPSAGTRPRRVPRAVWMALLVGLVALGGYRMNLAREQSAARASAGLLAMLQADRWTNSLGMVFAFVPGADVLFSLWETRQQDYAAYAQAARGVDGSWKNPGFSQGATHPVVNVNWADAQKFAAWLTEQERREGRLTAQQSYRLPTDVEWSRAVGLTHEQGSTPLARDAGGVQDVYPWGTRWPPPRGAGNYGASLDTDSFERTSPAGSFAANPFGLFDLGGNVWEWCEDYHDGSRGERVLRGEAWFNDNPRHLLSSFRGLSPGFRDYGGGFRVVVVGGSAR